jgi:subtilisin family serine protease
MTRVSTMASTAVSVGLAVGLFGCSERGPLSPQDGDGPNLEPRRGGVAARDVAPGYVIVLKEQANADLTPAIERAGGKVSRFNREISVLSATGLNAAAVAELRRRPDVEGLTPNIRLQWGPRPKLQVLPAAGTQGRIKPTSDQSGAELFDHWQWNLRVIHADDAWLTTNQGKGARVALLDSGIDATHIDLAGAVDPSCSVSFVPTEDALTDSLFHGTLNAGIIRTNGIRGASVAPDATLCSVKVGNAEGLTLEAILAGIIYAGTAGVDVANMSFGGYFDKTNPDDAVALVALQRAVNFASQHRVLLVASVGNDAIDLNTDPKNIVAAPAELNHVISVGATGPLQQQDFDRIASYSNFGRSAVDLFAPGGEFVEGVSVEEDAILGPCTTVIPGCEDGTRYILAIGTSQAAPHVAGAAAVIESQFPGDQTDEFLAQCLLKSADLVTGRRIDLLYGHGRRVETLDPRSYTNVRRLGSTLLRLRRYPEAMEAVDRGLALHPTSLDILENGAMVRLAQGDLAGARAVLKAAPEALNPTVLVTFVAKYWDLYWVLDDPQQQLLLRLTPEPFDDDRGAWGLALAATHALRDDQGKARAYADSARIAVEQQLMSAPQDAGLHMTLGLALASLGRKVDAIREGERGVTLLPVAKDWVVGPYLQHQLAWIYLLVDEPEKALDQLEPLLKIPYYLSPAWLRIDPTFAPLHGHPRFQRLVAGEQSISRSQ